LKPEDLYHSGLVVDDFDHALRWWSEVAGYQWCDELAIEQNVHTPEGSRTVPLRFTYSMSEPRIELVEAVPGTLWMPSTSGIHHFGYWSDDVQRDVNALVEGGAQIEVDAPLPDGSLLWAYCKVASGPRIELVSRSIQPMIAEWFATGHLPAG
jgi:hypothetical protein